MNLIEFRKHLEKLIIDRINIAVESGMLTEAQADAMAVSVLEKDLDEYDERQLVNELNRRICEREKGRCDYCGKSPHAPACKFPDRHAWLLKAAVQVGFDGARFESGIERARRLV